VTRNIFKATLNSEMSHDNCSRVDGRWLYSLMPEYHTPFWNTVKFTTGKCKSWLNLVLKVWTSKFVLKKSSFLTTNMSEENMYWDWSRAVESELEAILVLLELVKMCRLRPQYKFQRLHKSQKSYFLNILYFHQRELEITSVLPSVSRKTRNET
jgi:hypothetical protein